MIPNLRTCVVLSAAGFTVAAVAVVCLRLPELVAMLRRDGLFSPDVRLVDV